MSDRERDGAAPVDGETIGCEDALDKIYEYLDGELDSDWGERVRGHVEICRECYPHFNFERVFLDHVRGRAIEPERRERLARRVREVLAELD